jgi:hypothetical protein
LRTSCSRRRVAGAIIGHVQASTGCPGRNGVMARGDGKFGLWHSIIDSESLPAFILAFKTRQTPPVLSIPLWRQSHDLISASGVARRSWYNVDAAGDSCRSTSPGHLVNL